MMTVPCLRSILPSDIEVVNSNQAYLRHPKRLAYRCFLPDLTDFTILCCIGPNFHRHLLQSVLEKIRPLAGIRPCCSGLQVQGTANSPSSTIINFDCKLFLIFGLHFMAERAGFEPARQLMAAQSLSRRSRYDHFGTSPQYIFMIDRIKSPVK